MEKTVRYYGCQMYLDIQHRFLRSVKKCGIDYFMTTKISWNEKDKIPFDTFMWKGVDGTGLLTHFAPAKQYDKTDYNPFGFARSPYITTYNGILEPDYVMEAGNVIVRKLWNLHF